MPIFFPREPKKNDIVSIRFKRGDVAIYFIEKYLKNGNKSGIIKVREFVLPIEGSLTLADKDPYYISTDSIINVVIAATMSENDYQNGHTFDVDISAQAYLMEDICNEYTKNIQYYKQHCLSLPR